MTGRDESEVSQRTVRPPAASDREEARPGGTDTSPPASGAAARPRLEEGERGEGPDVGPGPEPTLSGARIHGAEQTGHRASHLPEGTATEAPAMEGTSVDAPAVQGIYRPDVGSGGEDIDEDDNPLPNRSLLARRPEHRR